MQVAFGKVRVKLNALAVLAYSNSEKLFVVDTDALSVSAQAVLVQKKECGKIHPI